MTCVPKFTDLVTRRICVLRATLIVSSLALGASQVAAEIGSAGGTPTSTITTDYVYNADGALTSVTVQVDQSAPETTYLTWANFTPDAGNAAAGTVGQANGNLIGVGPNPGSGFTTEYGFDRRNRLTAYAESGTSVGYTYHPTSTLASATLPAGDSLRFYHDGGALPQMVSIRQSSSGKTSGRMGPVRYLNDDSRQILLRPRKDVAGTYSATDQSIDAYRYDPYGGAGTVPAEGADSYDLSENPFRYAGEFQDPTWQGVYLRARWYAPQMQSFLTRDPRPNLNRFGYTDGNPVSRVDPSGESWNSFSGWMSREIVQPLERGPLAWSLTKEFLTGPFLGVASIFAYPSSWWHDPAHSAELGTFLALGAVGEGLMARWAVDDFFSTGLRAFMARHAVDVSLGAAQSVLGSVNWKNGHFNTRGFAAGLAMTFGSIVEGREIFGIGYRPYNLTADDIIFMGRNPPIDRDEMLVFRSKTPLGGGVGRAFDNASPLGEVTSMSLYHEGIVILGRGVANSMDEAWVTTENVGYQRNLAGVGRNKFDDLSDRFDNERRFQLVGRYPVEKVWREDFISLQSRSERMERTGFGQWKYAVSRGMPFVNNCHWYANAVVDRLGQPQP